MAGIEVRQHDALGMLVDDVGVVVIGRNEGERLRRCLESVVAPGRHVVYVDSGSTDDSVAMAQSKGVDIVALDMRIPFTAARARNAGFARLQALAPQCHLVQFVDGDCELIDGWLTAAHRFLDERNDVACVCGRLQERFPERSIYNRLCDLEWDRPPGETDACGGIALMRSEVFSSVGGFNQDLVAGEEPELCARLRGQGWKVWRLPGRMAWHDANMLRFGQWWKRSTRVGYAFAQSAWLRRSSGERPYLKARLRAWVWAAVLPASIAVACLAWGPGALLLALAYPFQVARIARAGKGPWGIRIARGVFLVLGRFAELRGQWEFWRSHRLGRASSTSFDYKS